MTSALQQFEWRISEKPVSYPEALARMEARVEEIRAGGAADEVWLLEHPPLYTAGTAAQAAHLSNPSGFPVYEAGRGGQWTYHGPGQRVAYVLADLKRLYAPAPPDLRAYLRLLERWLVLALAEFGVEGFVREGRTGVWVSDPARGECKIAAMGVRVRKWVAYHGVSLNVSPDLAHYAGIVPCGIRDYGVTSLAALGLDVPMEQVDAALIRAWASLSD